MNSRNTSLLDENVPELNVPVLQPKQYVPAPKPRRFRKDLRRFGDWLSRLVPAPVKRTINNAFEAFK